MSLMLSKKIFLLIGQIIVCLQNTSAHANSITLKALSRSIPIEKSSDYFVSRRSFSTPSNSELEWSGNVCDELSDTVSDYDEKEEREVQFCTANSFARISTNMNPLTRNLIRGAFLRVTSDLTGGTPLENIKTSVATSSDGPLEATRKLINGNNGFWNLWSGTPGRIVEGSLHGGVFMAGSLAAKTQVLNMGGSKTVAALAGGIIGGIAQACIMTPAALVFTSLNVNKGKPGHEDDNSFSVAKRIVRKRGIQGMFVGYGPMAARQATNWASRSLITEICRSSLKLSRFGSAGEIASGVIGGVSSCWNTPIETVRVLMQRDVSDGIPSKPYKMYISDVIDEAGVLGLYRGISPRAVQATWQTVFMVVVPNILGV